MRGFLPKSGLPEMPGKLHKGKACILEHLCRKRGRGRRAGKLFQ